MSLINPSLEHVYCINLVSNHVIIRLIRFVSRFTVHLCNAIYFLTTFSTLCKWFIKILHFAFWDLNKTLAYMKVFFYTEFFFAIFFTKVVLETFLGQVLQTLWDIFSLGLGYSAYSRKRLWNVETVFFLDQLERASTSSREPFSKIKMEPRPFQTWTWLHM